LILLWQQSVKKLELVDAMPVNCMREEYYFYAHVNFTARASGEEEEEGSSDQEQQQQLFFVELQLCGKRRAPPSGFLVTCCEPLGPDDRTGEFSFVSRCSVSLRKSCIASAPKASEYLIDSS
jgi:hypothetical protein